MSLITPDFGLLIWMTLIFAIVFFILAKFGFPVITGMVNKRKDYISQSLEEAHEAKASLENLAAEQKRLIEETRKEQARILKEAAQARESMISQAREQASAEADRIIAKAKVEIEAEKQSAMSEVRRDVAMLSVNVAEKLLRTQLEGKAAQSSFVDSVVDEMSRKSSN